MSEHAGCAIINDPETGAALIRLLEEAQAARRERMPDQETALHLMMDAYVTLKEMGWKESVFCPKDGTSFLVIEAGSIGVHRCHYSGEWPSGSWWIEADGDLWPSRPILWRPLPETSE